MDEWIAFVQEAQDLPWVRAIVVIGVSVLVAKIVDLLISRFLVRLTLRTNTDLDDQLVQVGDPHPHSSRWPTRARLSYVVRG